MSSIEFEERAYLQLTLRLIPFLMICYVIAYLDRVNVGFAKLQMLPDLAWNPTAGSGLTLPPLEQSSFWPQSRYSILTGVI